GGAIEEPLQGNSGGSRETGGARETDAAEAFVPPVWMSVTFLVMALACLGLTTPYLRQVIVDRESFPVEAVRAIAASGVRTNMATEFAWGEYVLWHLGPGVKVSTDGRRE